MITLPCDEVALLVSIELINDHTNRVLADVIPLWARKAMKDRAGNIRISDADDLLVRMTKKYVLSQAALEGVYAAEGEVTVDGVPYHQGMGLSREADLSLGGPGAIYGVVLREMVRRLEEELAGDRRQMLLTRWESPHDPPA